MDTPGHWQHGLSNTAKYREQLMERTKQLIRPVAVFLTTLFGLLGANLLFLHIYGGVYRITMGDNVAPLLLEAFHQVETDREGIPYRWTTGQSRIRFRDIASVPHAYLTLTIGGMPPHLAPRPLILHIEQSPLITLSIPSHAQRYRLLLPPMVLRDGTLEVGLRSEATKVPPDRRALGVQIREVEIGWLAPSLPTPPWHVLFLQGLLVGMVIVLLRSVHVPWWGIGLGAGVSIVAISWVTGAMLLFAAAWQFRLLVGITLVLILRFTVTTPQLAYEPERIPWLWLITIGAMAIRMVCILYPPFLSHDWYIHLERMQDVVSGELLLYDKPAEFSRKLTIVPPLPYLLYAPFLLLIEQVIPATQLVYSVADGLTVLLTGMLVQQVGGGRGSAGIAALIIALFPLHLTALWWGFGPQIIGQLLVVWLAYLIAHHHPSHHPVQTPRFWLLVSMVATMLLLSHVGAAMLGGSLLVCYIVLTARASRSWYSDWKKWAMIAVGSGTIAIVLLYSQVLTLQLQGLSSNERLRWDADDLFRIPWTILSLYSSFKPIGVAIPAASMLIAVWTTRSTHQWLIVSWLLSAGIFFVIDLITGLQVRYAYFILPVVAIGLAFLFEQLTRRHRWGGYVVTWSVLGIIAAAGLNLWLSGVFLGIKPSLRGLTH